MQPDIDRDIEALSDSRSVPLVVLGALQRDAGERLARSLRAEGMVVYVTTGEQGCLRVATATAPDLVLLDPRLPARLATRLRTHPACRRATIASSAALATGMNRSAGTAPLAHAPAPAS